MRCPVCFSTDTKVIDSRSSDDGTAIRRRRECVSCKNRFTTYERLCETTTIVVKSDKSAEAYNREKLMRGLLIACAKRPVSPNQIERLVDEIEQFINTKRNNQITSTELGNLALEKLLALDEVAYIRFASVYKDFKTVDEFAEAIRDFSDND